jgi:hypothetical protein
LKKIKDRKRKEKETGKKVEKRTEEEEMIITCGRR